MKLREMYTKLYQQYKDAQEMDELNRVFEIKRIQNDCYKVTNFLDLQDELTAGHPTMENAADKDPFYGLAGVIYRELKELCQMLYSSYPTIYDAIESLK